MIGHYGVHHVLGAPLRHVTLQGIFGGVVGAGVATLANSFITPDGLFPPAHLMRVMACGTGKRAAAFRKTRRFQKAVTCPGNFKLVIVTGAWGVVEVKDKV